MKKWTSNIFLILGIGLLIFGVLLYLSYWYFIWGFVSLIIGTILIFLTKKDWRFKLVCILIPIGFVGISFYQSFAPKETYLIQDDFVGEFRVIYSEECGIEPTNEKGRRILIIPDNGILIVRPKFKAGWVNNEYYLVDKKGNRKKLNELFNYKERLTKSPGVLMGGSGSMTGEMPDGNSSSESPLAIHFTDFTVFNKDTTIRSDKESFKFHQRFDSLTTALVEVCRKNKAYNPAQALGSATLHP